MLHRMSSIMLCMLSALSFASCSVKEDRTVCPCVLILDFCKVDKGLLNSLDLSVMGQGGILCQDVVQSEFYGEEYRTTVPKGSAMLNVYSFLEGNGYGMLDTGNAVLEIPAGCECPPVYMYSVMIDTGKEMHREEVVPGKNFCRLSIEMVSEGPCPFILEINGNVDGYGCDGLPKEGMFSFVPYTDVNGCSTVNIPRQKDCSLRLRICDEDGVVKDFAVGEYIVEMGYDWTRKDLEDVGIIIDYARTDVTFIVDDWEKTVSFDVII
ncbi:MAG: hypothetical protein NC115_10780 [Bacteroidales bacterium]|nr:hypothetical protein [Bacteroides sp.]MCM1198041.1 hypothetical protein [Clostridium sp.]MCM1503129.1 hypothetical protein [Bacteroidales bacterium]